MAVIFCKNGKMRCCCQISIAENHIVLNAKPTRLDQKKKHAVIVFMFSQAMHILKVHWKHIFFSTHVEDICYCQHA